jgi:hypothetical protein
MVPASARAKTVHALHRSATVTGKFGIKFSARFPLPSVVLNAEDYRFLGRVLVW